MYDTALDTWVTLEPMPTSRANFAIVALSGKIYCIGGEVLDEPGAYRVYRIVEVYDIVTDSWSVKKDIPFDGLGIQAHVIDGKIFVISKGQDLFIYDPITDKWTQKTSMPRPEDIAVSAKFLDTFSIATDNKIMVYFKYAPYDSVPTLPFIFKGKVMTYDTKTNVWSEEGKKPPNVLAIAGGCITSGIYAPQRVYIFGTNNTLIYNPVNDVWSTSKTMPTYREQFGVAVVDDILYVIGGRGADFDPIIFSENERYVPNSYVGTSRSGALTAIIGATTIVAVVTIFTGIILLQKRKNANKKLMT
jgi:N-acetylneuraminic acid mutarotase